MEFYLLIFLICRTRKYQETYTKEMFQNKKKRDKTQEGVDRFQLSHIGNYLSKILRGYTDNKPQYFGGGQNSLKNEEH